MRAAGYIRVSQERAARNGYGLDAQEADIQRFVEYKNWELIELYREEGASGYRKDRPRLDRLLADAKAGRFDIAIFPSIDRVGRSVRDVIDIDNALRNTGVDIVFMREGVDTSTPTGEFFEIIMASIAQFEGRIVYDRLSKGKQQKASRGGYTGGWLPYGYRRGDKGRVKVVPEQAKVVRRIFRWVAKGQSIKSITRRLREGKVPTRNGGMWRRSTVRGMLRNPFYAGRVEFEGKLVRGQHKAIVSMARFSECNRRDGQKPRKFP